MTTENKKNNVAEIRVKTFGFGANKVQKYAVVRTQPIFSDTDFDRKNPIHVTFEGQGGALAFPLTTKGLENAHEAVKEINERAASQSNNRRKRKASN
jgi:hypothetical protein